MKQGDVDAFGRLRNLIGGVQPPAGVDPIALHLGEQRLAVPVEVLSEMEAGTGWSRYPPLGGSKDLRQAYVNWLQKRFDIGSAVADGRAACEPTPGSKQSSAVAIMLAVARARRRGHENPVVVLPDLCYPTYRAAAATAGARVLVFDPEASDPVDGVALPIAGLRSPLAAIVVCNPGNPTGRTLTQKQIEAWAHLAGAHGATLIVDECYVDLWLDDPVAGALQLLAQGAVPCPVLVLHTLSKRSGAPGLRSGFVAGDPTCVAEYAGYNRACGVSLPVPICTVSAALWRDGIHVERLRKALRETWRLTDSIMSELPGYRRPEAGFFLWLPVDDGEAVVKKLWREVAVLAMPGAYLAATDKMTGAAAAARNRLRIALIHPPATLAPALTRLKGIVVSHLGTR